MPFDAIVVCAAGNEGYDLDVTPPLPCQLRQRQYSFRGRIGRRRLPDVVHQLQPPNRADVAAPGTDILSTVPDRQTFLADDFADTDNWAFGGPDNRWGVEKISDGRQVLSESPGYSDYSDNVDTWAVTAVPLNLTGRTGVRMDFQITGIGADDGDHLSVEASTDQTDWTRLRVGLEDGGTAETISGSLPAWQWAAVDLGDFDGSAEVYLRFHFVSDADGTADGYSIADLTITCAGTTDESDTYQYFQGTSMSAAYALRCPRPWFWPARRR